MQSSVVVRDSPEWAQAARPDRQAHNAENRLSGQPVAGFGRIPARCKTDWHCVRRLKK